MPLRVYIDDPPDLQIDRTVCNIRGWCAADSLETARALQFRIAGSRVPYDRIPRPDVEEALPGKFIRGFLINLDLSFHIQSVWNGECLLCVIAANEPVVELRFRVSQQALRKCLEDAVGT